MVQEVDGWLRSLRKQWFLIALLGAVTLGFVWPEPGQRDGWLMSQWTTKIAVFLIFLIQGLGIPTRELWQGVKAYRVHLFVQLWVFAVFPVLVVGMVGLGKPWMPEELRMGFYYLGILPTTITSAVFFTGRAEGNVAVSIFNTTLANVLSVFVVPVWATLLILGDVAGEVSLANVVLRLCVLIILPMVLGQVARPWVQEFVRERKPWFGRATSWLIVFIMYCTFCDSVAGGTWERLGLGVVVWALAGGAMTLGLASALVWWSAGWSLLGLDRSTRVAAFFCASQKSLATGVPMAASIFGASALGMDVAVLVIPLMCYHVFQLSLAAWLSGVRMTRKGG